MHRYISYTENISKSQKDWKERKYVPLGRLDTIHIWVGNNNLAIKIECTDLEIAQKTRAEQRVYKQICAIWEVTVDRGLWQVSLKTQTTDATGTTGHLTTLWKTSLDSYLTHRLKIFSRQTIYLNIKWKKIKLKIKHRRIFFCL